MKCESCGAMTREGDRYCSYCGTEIGERAAAAENVVQHVHVHEHRYYYEQPVQETTYVVQEESSFRSPKNRVILLIVYLFTGALGGHKFYAGRFGMGLLYLFTGGLFGIGLICDFFSILLGTPKDGHGLPIRW